MSAVDWHSVFILCLTGVAIILFAWERIALSTSAFAVLVTVVLLFQLFPYEANDATVDPTEFFSGFGHQALISIAALMILGRALERTGALRPVARAMSRLWPRHPNLALLATLLLGALFSAFVNNTPIVVMLLPMLVSVCIRNNQDSTSVLMPVGIASIIGGMSTTIGTSTNLLVVTIASDMGLKEFGMFEFALPAVLAGTAGIVFLWLTAPHIVPTRQPPLSDESPRLFTSAFTVTEKSELVGLTLAEVLAKTDGQVVVQEIVRNSVRIMRFPTVRIKVGDKIVVLDTPDNLKDYEQIFGVTLSVDTHDSTGVAADSDDGEERLAEIVVMPGSYLYRRTLIEIDFSMNHSLTPVAVSRMGASVSLRDFQSEQLREGDVLLLQGTRKNVARLRDAGVALVLDGTDEMPKSGKAPIAIAIMTAVVGLAALQVAPISVAASSGVLAMLLFRCVSWRDVTGAISAPVVLIIVASLALGNALVVTGGAKLIAAAILMAVADMPLPVILATFMLAMSLLTNVVSNNAAAIIGTPIAVDIATGLSADFIPFLLAVIFGANMSFATPIGYQTNLLVMSAGGYRFLDFARVGIPLTLLMIAILTVILTAQFGAL